MTCAVRPRVDDESHVVADVMSDVATRLHADLHVRDAVAFFDERAMASAWVVDDAGHLVGCLRENDVARHRQSLPEARVHSIMSRAVAVEEHCSVYDALVQMARSHVRELAIVSRDGALVGVVRDVDGLRLLGSRRR